MNQLSFIAQDYRRLRSILELTVRFAGRKGKWPEILAAIVAAFLVASIALASTAFGRVLTLTALKRFSALAPDEQQ